MKVAVHRKAYFNAAHRLHNPEWSAEKNKKVFGKCNNPNYHGHNYELEVKVVGEVDQETGYVIDLIELKQLIKEHVVDRFHYKNLNEDIDEFENRIPSTENLAALIYQILRDELNDQYDLQVKLYETERNFVTYPPTLS
jgi:6-pyruvoyltetrahydropterin/6-carboxytetrahydropterin synthase